MPKILSAEKFCPPKILSTEILSGKVYVKQRMRIQEFGPEYSLILSFICFLQVMRGNIHGGNMYFDQHTCVLLTCVSELVMRGFPMNILALIYSTAKKLPKSYLRATNREQLNLVNYQDFHDFATKYAPKIMHEDSFLGV